VGLTGSVVPFPLDLAATGPFCAEKIFGKSWRLVLKSVLKESLVARRAACRRNSSEQMSDGKLLELGVELWIYVASKKSPRT
jgi:hypothetical protein